MSEQTPIPGYLRCHAIYVETTWQIELESEQEKVALVTIATAEGALQVGLNREDAVILQQRLQLFLADWPKDQGSAH